MVLALALAIDDVNIEAAPELFSSTVALALLGLVSVVGAADTRSMVELVSGTDATLLGLVSADGGVKAGSMVELVAVTDAMILELVSVIGEINAEPMVEPVS